MTTPNSSYPPLVYARAFHTCPDTDGRIDVPTFVPWNGWDCTNGCGHDDGHDPATCEPMGDRPAPWAVILPGDRVIWRDWPGKVTALADASEDEALWLSDEPRETRVRIWWDRYAENEWMPLAELTLDLDRIEENPTRQATGLMP